MASRDYATTLTIPSELGRVDVIQVLANDPHFPFCCAVIVYASSYFTC